MIDDKEFQFRPKVGNPRDRGKKRGKRFLNQVKRAADNLNYRLSNRGGSKGNRFTGRHSGRGFAHGTASSARGGRHERFRNRRVIVKARFVKLAGQGFAKGAAHIRYLGREGVGKEREDAQFYNADHDDRKPAKFQEDCKDDRHQFRLIVSPEDAHELENLKSFTRDLMSNMESDLGTKLDYIAIDHFNTDNLHTHIIIRGRDETGKDLVIARNYIAHGIRERASELATQELGPRQDHEIQNAMRREADRDRFTSIDHELVKESSDHVIDTRDGPPAGYARFKHSLKMARLEKLGRMGLAKQTAPGIWHLSPSLESTLRDLGQKDDIIKTMHAEMTKLNRDPATTNYEIFHPQDQPDKKITGRVLSKGLSDEVNDRYFAIVEGVDGKTHYAELGQQSKIDEIQIGAIVEIAPHNTQPRQVDLTIAAIARNNNGRYSVTLHTEYDPKASEEFIRSHIRRLEAQRRIRLAQRLPDGSWQIPGSYLSEIEQIETQKAVRNPMSVAIRSNFSLEVQATATGATWLDHTLLNREKIGISNTGFGKKVEDALKKRIENLVERGLAKQAIKGIRFQRSLLKSLERRELQKAAKKINQETGKVFRELRKGQKIEGVYKRPVELVSGKFAMIENAKEFNLVPWRSVLERARNKSVAGRVTGAGISWDITRQKGLTVN